MKRINDFIYGFMFCFFVMTVILNIKESYALKSFRASSEYNDPVAIRNEFDAVYLNLQPKVQVFQSTPALSDLAPGDVIISSQAAKNLIFRVGSYLYNVPAAQMP